MLVDDDSVDPGLTTRDEGIIATNFTDSTFISSTEQVGQDVTPSPPTDQNSIPPTSEGPKDGIEQNKAPFRCETGDALLSKVNHLIKERVPRHVRLQDVTYGRNTRLVLNDGFIALAGRELVAPPVCVEMSANEKRYDFIVKFDQPAGAYHWKIENLFGRMYSENALLFVS